MSDCLEVLFVSDKSGKVQTVSCYDPHVGTTLMSYKSGGGSATRTLSIIGNDYLISADENKPILHFWPLNSQEPSQDLKTVAPGKPTALSVSPDGHYCTAGIEGKIYIWEISSGCLLNVISRHYQAINKIVFTDDSSYFITCGEDGLILVWKLADVFPKKFDDVFKLRTGQVAPVYNFTNHLLPVTDIFVGFGNLNAKLYSVSADQTCKVFSLNDGSLLLSIIFNYVLTSITVNELETEMFVGTGSGKIQVFNLDPCPRSLEYHVPENLQNDFFIGHTKSVNFLSVSLNGSILASGSDDEKVFLWNIPGRQLIRSFEMKGSISGMFFSLVSENIFSNKFNPTLVVSKFEKVNNLEEKSLELNVWVHENISPISFESVSSGEVNSCKSQEEGSVESLKQQILKLKSINKQLYQFAINKILKNPLSIGMKIENAVSEILEMAQIADRKSTLYSQKQSVRDEESAPLYLESAGDILVKSLAKKQTNTITTLKEQLGIVQNFEKGFELNPEIQKGIVPLKEFQARIKANEESCNDTTLRTEKIQDVDELMKITGLSRHELDLSLSEKPNSARSRLYKFAISSRRQKHKSDLKSQLLDHPIHKLKEIEKEYFGHLKKDKVEVNVGRYQDSETGEKRPRKRKRGKRKRKRKGNNGSTTEWNQSEDCQLVVAATAKEESDVQVGTSRLSLWDIKDMKKWSESKTIGCAPRKYYTIKDANVGLVRMSTLIDEQNYFALGGL